MTELKRGKTYRQNSCVAHSEKTPIPYSEIERRIISAYRELGVAVVNKSLWVGEDDTLKPKVYLLCSFDITPDSETTSLKLIEGLQDKTGFEFFSNFFLQRRDKPECFGGGEP